MDPLDILLDCIDAERIFLVSGASDDFDHRLAACLGRIVALYERRLSTMEAQDRADLRDAMGSHGQD